MSLATLTNAGRAAFALSLSQQPLHIALAQGLPEWEDTEAPLPDTVTMTALTNEMGRRVPNIVGFVVPDEEGGIVISEGLDAGGSVVTTRYRMVSEPTPYLYMQVAYDLTDAPSGTIRQMGIFVGSTVREGLPPGQRFFTPDEIDDPGLLLAVEILQPAIPRNPQVRQAVEFVLPV